MIAAGAKQLVLIRRHEQSHFFAKALAEEEKAVFEIFIELVPALGELGDMQPEGEGFAGGLGLLKFLFHFSSPPVSRRRRAKGARPLTRNFCSGASRESADECGDERP